MYELLDGQGRVAPIVLKAARQVALISDTQREWATGQRLAALGPGEPPHTPRTPALAGCCAAWQYRPGSTCTPQPATAGHAGFGSPIPNPS